MSEVVDVEVEGTVRVEQMDLHMNSPTWCAKCQFFNRPTIAQPIRGVAQETPIYLD